MVLKLFPESFISFIDVCSKTVPPRFSTPNIQFSPVILRYKNALCTRYTSDDYGDVRKVNENMT